MSSFGLDNVGSGFNLDDDEDFESMLGRASAASEDDGDLDFKKSQSPEVPAFHTTQEVEAEQEPQVEEEPVAEEVAEEQYTPEPEPQPELEPTVEEPVVEQVPAYVPAPSYTQTAVEEPAFAPPTPPSASSPHKTRVRVPTEAEQVSDAARIINILDVYRKLTPEEKTVTVQFVTDGEMESADDATLVVKVLNADPMLTTTMRALREAYECDSVERAFYAMALETRTLHNMGSLVSVFSDEEYDETLPNLAYSRVVVASIAQLSDREISFVKATESVLAAAETTGA